MQQTARAPSLSGALVVDLYRFAGERIAQSPMWLRPALRFGRHSCCNVIFAMPDEEALDAFCDRALEEAQAGRFKMPDLLGALPFAWYIRGIYRRRFRSEQVEAMLVTLAVVIGGLTLWLRGCRGLQ